jgi:UrcA family protein
MKKKTNLVLAAAILAGGVAGMGYQAFAQQAYTQRDESITVQAPRMIHRETVGRSVTGAPIEEVSLTRRVYVGDLDLRRVADNNELDRRIDLTAREACDQLNRLYPADMYPAAANDRDCVKSAIHDAMLQKQTFISSR